MSGFLSEKIGSSDELKYVTNSRGIGLVIDSLQTGFWLGRPMWRGRILVSTETQPGQYEIVLFTQKGGKENSVNSFRIRVFRDEAGLRKASASYIRRYLGISPWWAAPFFFLLIVLMFGAVFFLSRKREGLLAKDGKAEVYRVLKGEASCMVYFGLGSRQGIHPGTSVTLLNVGGERIGTAVVEDVFEDHAIARTERDFSVWPGPIIVRSGLPHAHSVNQAAC